MRFGKNLKKERIKNELTQKKLAELLDIAQSNISDWENEISRPEYENLIKLAKIFKISVDELLDYDNYDYNFEYKHNETSLIHKEKIKK